MRSAIFIFTKENSFLLESCLSQFKILNYEYDLFVLDDSFEEKTIRENREIVNQFGIRARHMGSEEFRAFYDASIVYRLQTHERIGTNSWNLGTVRNWAMDYSRANKYDKALLIDHDIFNVTPYILRKGFESLTGNNFVSCKIAGVRDDSVIGHLSHSLGLEDCPIRLLSGGFLFLSPGSIRHRFLNIYNEDWILQLMEHDKQRVELDYTVNHQGHSPFTNYQQKILFQELGELVIDGLLNDAAVKTDSFWKSIIQKRRRHLLQMKEKASDVQDKNALDIIAFLYDRHSQFIAADISHYFN